MKETPSNLIEAINLDNGGKKLIKLDGEFREMIEHVMAGNPASKLTITIEANNAGRERYTNAQQIEYTIDSKLDLKKRKPSPTVLFATDQAELTEWNPVQNHLPGVGSRARSAEEIED